MDRLSRRRKRNTRYRRYRIFFFILFGIFFLSALTELLVWGSQGTVALPTKQSYAAFLIPLLVGEELLCLISFFLGVTVYAPFFTAFLAALRGIFSGFVFSSLMFFPRAESVFLLLLCGIYLLASGWIFCCYAAFCGTVSLRLYSEGILKTPREEEKRMFGGTLFNSVLFCNTVNIRFLCSYCGIFLLFLSVTGINTSIFALFRQWIV